MKCVKRHKAKGVIMAKRLFCRKHKRVSIGKAILVNDKKSWMDKDNVKHWELKCGCVLKPKELQENIVHQMYYLDDGTLLKSSMSFKQWEITNPPVDFKPRR